MPKCTEALKDEWRLETDSVAAFAQERLEKSEDVTQLKELYARYKHMMDEDGKGRWTLGKSRFSKRLLTLGFEKTRVSAGMGFKVKLVGED